MPIRLALQMAFLFAGIAVGGTLAARGRQRLGTLIISAGILASASIHFLWPR